MCDPAVLSGHTMTRSHRTLFSIALSVVVLAVGWWLLTGGPRDFRLPVDPGIDENLVAQIFDDIDLGR